MPAIGVSVKGVPADWILRLLKKENQLAISEMSIFELSAEGAKYAATGKIPVEKVLQGMKAITSDDRILKIPAYGEHQLKIAFLLRKDLKDFIDCLIVSSALTNCEILVTEDTSILELQTVESFKQLVETHNSKFTIQRSAETLISLA